MPKKQPELVSRKKALVGGAVALVLLLGAAAWALRGEGVDPAVAALEAQRARVFSPDATDEDRQAFRAQVESLTDDQRRQLFERGRPEMMRRMTEGMNALFTKSPEDLRREAASRAADIIAARAGREGDGQGRGPGGGPPWERGDMTDAQRDQMRKQMLDHIPPNTRAQFSEFRRMINEELKARGQEEISGRDMRTLFRGGPPGGRPS